MAATDLSILRFIRRTLTIACVVIMPFVVWFVGFDPFKVARHHDVYYENPSTNPLRIGLNKGIVSVNTYLNNLREGQSYNAFIFGSSISCYYNADEWRDLIAASRDTVSAEIHPFHFDSSNETPMTMSRKVEYLHRSGAPIDYALLVIDPFLLRLEDNESPFAIDPVELQPGFQYFVNYYYTFFRAATSADFIKNFVAAKITGKAEDIGTNPIFEKQPIIHNRLTNEERLPMWDSLITANPSQFYNDNPLLPPPSVIKANDPVITEEKRDAFNKIARIFDEQGTDYHIIISPNRRGISLSQEDLKILQSIFPSSRIHDFSTVYANELRVDTNLYDNLHYRPPFASKLMREVYAGDR